MKHEKVRTIEKVLVRLGFHKAKPKKKCAHHHWNHPDGRYTDISNHGCNEIGGGLFLKILKDIRISEDEFNELKKARRSKNIYLNKYN